MIRFLFSFLKPVFFYLLLFLFWRIAFLFYNYPDDMPLSSGEILRTLFVAVRMDLSVIGYIMVLPLLATFFVNDHIRSKVQKVITGWHVIVIIILTLILAGNLILYSYWKTPLNYRALTFLREPGHVFSSLSFWQMIMVFAVLTLAILLTILLFRRIRVSQLPQEISPYWKHATGYIILSFLVFTMIRGGWQKFPLNESMVYHSDNRFINQATVNPAWHLMYDVRAAGLTEDNPFNVFPPGESGAIVAPLFESGTDSFPKVLSRENPNVVIIILESFTADVVESLGGEAGIAPSMEKLIGDGLLFTRIYSSGSRTDQGIVSILNGYPSPPYHSMMRSPERSSRLPSLPKIFKQKGFHTSFYYGGESNFSNMNVYLINLEFERVVDKDDFPKSTGHGRWGVHDEYTFSKQLKEMGETPQPFFSVIMTLNNHEPFDVPGTKRFPDDSPSNKFRNSAAYTDECLGRYFEQAAKQPWFENTLFVIVADHGHVLPMNRDEVYPECRRIPMLLYGKPLDSLYQGKKIPTLGGHHDLAATLLPQFGVDAGAFNWSRNLLDTSRMQYAYYQIEHVLGWIEADSMWFAYCYNPEFMVAKHRLLTRSRLDSMMRTGQAYMQELYGDYLEADGK